MSRSVLKFPVPLADPSGDWPTTSLPVSTIPPRLCGQDPSTGGPALWFEVADDAQWADCRVLGFATGAEIPAGWSHLGSAVCGPLVWHIYIEPRAKAA